MKRGKRWPLGTSLALALVGVLTIPSLGRGQVPNVGLNPNQIAQRLADAVRDLADDLAAGPGRNPAGQYFEPDARELQTTIAQWAATTRVTGDPVALRQSYSGVDVAWHRLQGQIQGANLVDPAVGEEMRRVEGLDNQVHQALGLNAYPVGGGYANPAGPNVPVGVPAPVGPGLGNGVGIGSVDPNETRRLAYAAAQRAEALVGVARAERAINPALGPRLAEVDQLAQSVDGFYDALSDPNLANQPDFARNNYIPIVRLANALGPNLDAAGMSPTLRANWGAFATAHNYLRNNLGLNAPTIDGLPAPVGVAPGGIVEPNPSYAVGPDPRAQVVGWSVELQRQVDDLLVHFAPTVGVVPEGRFMLGDIERMRQTAAVFRQEAERGADPGRLAAIFSDFDAHWQRLARRVNRIGRGRTGPNINRISEIGLTAQQVHQALALPGAPSVITSY